MWLQLHLYSDQKEVCMTRYTHEDDVQYEKYQKKKEDMKTSGTG